MKSPIFIFSLPRSGSTLLQKILMSHSKIASTAEPWILLPFVYTLKNDGTLTNYSHYLGRLAFESFINDLPKKREDYIQALRLFLTSLYEKQCRKGETYFLDKTPRYYLIIPEILEIFPRAKFIFLFRNPVHVHASIMSTWGQDRFYIPGSYIDLSSGPRLLSEGFEKSGHNSIAVNYETLVIEPENTLKDICNYLELYFEESMLNDFSKQSTHGIMGDKSESKSYSQIGTFSLNKWEKVFNTKFRQKVLNRYISSFDEKTLFVQGYDKKAISRKIMGIELNGKYSPWVDILDIIRAYIVRMFHLNRFLGKSARWSKGIYLS